MPYKVPWPYNVDFGALGPFYKNPTLNLFEWVYNSNFVDTAWRTLVDLSVPFAYRHGPLMWAEKFGDPMTYLGVKRDRVSTKLLHD